MKKALAILQVLFMVGVFITDLIPFNDISFVRSTTLFDEGNLVLCSLIENDVLTSLEMMLTASGQTML